MILTALVTLTYPLVIQYKRGGLWASLKPLAGLVLALDILASITEWRLVFGPSPHWTITQRIRAMHADPIESRRMLANLVQVYLDACEPDGKH